MLKRIMMAGAICFSGTYSFAGDDFAPIPANVWSIKDGAKGAVVLEDRMRFSYTSLEFTYRVRIFSEAGREAAEIEDLPSNASRIRGRTVYPDGRQVVFNSRKDFAERRTEVGSREHKRTHLVAPGVTTDCVVEFKWSEPANGRIHGLPERFAGGLYGRWTLGNAFPTQTLAIEVSKPYPLAWSLTPGGTTSPEVKDSSSNKEIIFRNLPAMEHPPYALDSTLQFPTLVIFWQPDNVAGLTTLGPERYWNEAISDFYKPEYEDSIDKGSAFKALSKELTAGLPTSPVASAQELLNRLNAKIANLSHATFAEVASLPKDFWEGFEPKNLGKASKTGRTNSEGMKLLYYHLLQAAGIKPLIGKVPNRDVTLFDWQHLNPWQFDRDLIGIEESGKGVLWLDPSLRAAMPGVLAPEFTWVPAFVIDSKTWKGSKGSIAGGGVPNARKYTFQIELGEDGDQFKMSSEFGGYPEYLERSRYLALDPVAQSKELKERFENAMKNLVISSAEVNNAADVTKNVTWHVEGSIEREPQRRRVVDPFPGMPWPLWVPSKLDETRTSTIVLPYPCAQVAVATFKAPKGFVMEPQLPIKEQNTFGKVIWMPTFDATTGEIKVVLRVEVTGVIAAADQWGNLKVFLGWVEEACRRQVSLKKDI